MAGGQFIPDPQPTGQFIAQGEDTPEAAAAPQFVPDSTPPEEPESHGFLADQIVRPLKAGAKAALSGIKDTAEVVGDEVAGGESGVSSSPSGSSSRSPQPWEQPYAWKDVLTGGWIGKTAYGLGKSSPAMAGAALGGWAITPLAGAATAATAAGGITAPAAPFVGAGIEAVGIFSGAVLGNAAANLGPFYKEALDNGKSPDEAWSYATKRATKESAITGLSYAAFEIAPFASAVKNLLLQAFVVQPGISVTAKAVGNVSEGKPVTEGLGQEYAQTAAGMAPFILSHEARAGLESVTSYGARMARKAHYEGLATEIRGTFDPTNISPEAKETGGAVKERWGELYQREEVSRQQFHELNQDVKDLTPAQSLEFMDAMENGRTQSVSALQPVADALRRELDRRRDMVQSLGRRDGKNYLENYYEDYFPHLWKDPKAAHDTLIAGSRSLGGNTSFLKQREIEYIKDGVAQGLELKTYNPVAIAFSRIHQMDKFIFGREVWQDMKDRGFVKFAATPDAAPDGWVPVEDRISKVSNVEETTRGEKVRVERGQYYAKPEVNRILTRVNEAGLRKEIPYLHATASAAKNFMNAIQLGFSAFHFGFAAFDVPTSELALAAQELSRGRFTEAGKHALLPVASLSAGLGLGSINPALGYAAMAAIANAPKFLKGRDIRRAYSGKEKGIDLEIPNPFNHKTYRKAFSFGPYGKEMQATVDSVIKAGAQVRMPEMWKFAQRDSYWRAMEDLSNVKEGDFMRKVKFFPRLAQTLSSPLMEHMVPNVKLAVFAEMAKASLDHNPGMGLSQARDKMQEHWASVENRLGELNMDHLFWSRALVDSSWLALRSPGWKIGTVREIGGALPDLINQARKTMKGQKPELTNKMAYSFIALPVYSMLASAVYQYVKTKTWPGQDEENLIGYIYPWDGGYDSHGQKTRKALPTYLAKDVMGWYHDWTHELVAGMAPTIQEAEYQLANKDYQGAAIRDPTTDRWTQAYDSVAHMLKSIEPFAVQGSSKEAGKEGEMQAEPFLGITNAPSWASQSEETAHALEIKSQMGAIRKRRRVEAQENLGEDY